jgi:putative ABC transport system permease protein
VTALALVIALGTGAYAGLGGTTAWRLTSNDESYAALRMHDLRVRLPDGGFARTGALAAAVRGIPDADRLAAVEERLIVSTQVDASTREHTVLVPGEIVGMNPDAQVDTLYLAAGKGLAGDPTGSLAVLESKFAEDHGLATRGDLVISGGRQVHHTGLGYTPEYFRISGRSGSLLGETGFAVLFMPLATAQQLTGRSGMANDLVLRLTPGADSVRVRAQVSAAVAPLGGTVTAKADDIVYRGLYADARNDATTWNMFALLILLGAALAAFNLVTRMIDAQRRELGVGMALGVSTRLLVLRPLLAGVQIAVAGVALGVGVGWLMALAMRREMAKLLPLPIWLTPFQTGRFLAAAALGFLIPLAATLLPLRRVLRLQPVEALRGSAYTVAARGGRLAAAVRRLRLPGRSYTNMPLRDVVRAPRRTALTAIGIGSAITCMVAVLGLLDSFTAVGQRSSAELDKSAENRLTVSLSSVLPANSETVRGVTATPGVGATVAQLRLPTRLTANGHTLDAVTTVLDLHNPVWVPTVLRRASAVGEDGIVLSEKAAADLHVQPGDTIAVQHPQLTTTTLRLVTSQVRVAGVHPGPLRPIAYLDSRFASLFGPAGLMNELVAVPAAGVSQDRLLRALFDRPAVAAVEPTTGFSKMLDYRLGQFTGILRVIEVVTLLLALLIAFNTAKLAAEERARDHATMLAFGLPQRTIALMAVAENAVIGLFGSLLGVGFGYIALSWIVSGFDRVMPDISVRPSIFATTLVTTVLLGVAVVAMAPLLNLRRQRRADISATLRVVE